LLTRKFALPSAVLAAFFLNAVMASIAESNQMQTNQDIEQLKLLTVFHYVAAALMTFLSLLPVVHLVMGVAILNGSFDNMANGQVPPREAGWALIAFASLLIIVGLTISACVALAGRRLQTYRSYTFCLVIASSAWCFR
jgi:hypothetical protein